MGLTAVVLSLKLLIPQIPLNFALPVRLPNKRRMLLGDVSEMIVLDEVFREGIYDVPALPSSANVILDLGANAGAASEFFAQRYPSSTIVAYEADPHVGARAKRNLAGLSAEVRIAAISDTTSPVRLRRVRGLSWGTSALGQRGEVFEVPGETLNNIIRPYGHVDILKLDIEGSEYAAVKACDELTRVDLVIGEFHPVPGVTAEDFFGLLGNFDLLSDGGQERVTFVATRRHRRLPKRRQS